MKQNIFSTSKIKIFSYSKQKVSIDISDNALVTVLNTVNVIFISYETKTTTKRQYTLKIDIPTVPKIL